MKKEDAKKEEGRRKKEEGRRKKEEGRRKKEEIVEIVEFIYLNEVVAIFGFEDRERKRDLTVVWCGDSEVAERVVVVPRAK